MPYTRVLLQNCKPGTVELLTRSALETFVPRIRQVPGFINYKVIKLDDRTNIAIGTFESRAGAEEMERLGKKWREDHDEVISATPYIGEVIADENAVEQAWQPTA